MRKIKPKTETLTTEKKGRQPKKPNMKTIIETKKTITETHEIDLPYYCKNGVHIYKVFSPDQCIQVYQTSWDAAVGCQILSASIAFSNGNELAEEHEFETKFNEAMEILQEYSSEDKAHSKSITDSILDTIKVITDDYATKLNEGWTPPNISEGEMEMIKKLNKNKYNK